MFLGCKGFFLFNSFIVKIFKKLSHHQFTGDGFRGDKIEAHSAIFFDNTFRGVLDRKIASQVPEAGGAVLPAEMFQFYGKLFQIEICMAIHTGNEEGVKIAGHLKKIIQPVHDADILYEEPGFLESNCQQCSPDRVGIVSYASDQ